MGVGKILVLFFCGGEKQIRISRIDTKGKKEDSPQRRKVRKGKELDRITG